MHRRAYGIRRIALASLCVLLVGCSPHRGGATPAYPTYDPFVPLGGTPLPAGADTGSAFAPTRPPGPTPTRAALSITIPTRDPNAGLATPTPDLPRLMPTPRQSADQYTVQHGDTLGSIAETYGVSVQSLQEANKITDENLLAVGTTLFVPPPPTGLPGTSFKIIPDSELVYGPASALFDLDAFVQSQGGYLASYTEDVDTQTLTGAQVILRVAQDYSINPRLLLALIEHRSHWVTSPDPRNTTLDYPLGFE